MFDLKPLCILYKLFTHNLTKYKEVEYKTMISGMCELNEFKFLNLQDLVERGFFLKLSMGNIPTSIWSIFFCYSFLIFRIEILFLVCRRKIIIF
jgi:hypothetical protein